MIFGFNILRGVMSISKDRLGFGESIYIVTCIYDHFFWLGDVVRIAIGDRGVPAFFTVHCRSLMIPWLTGTFSLVEATQQTWYPADLNRRQPVFFSWWCLLNFVQSGSWTGSTRTLFAQRSRSHWKVPRSCTCHAHVVIFTMKKCLMWAIAKNHQKPIGPLFSFGDGLDGWNMLKPSQMVTIWGWCGDGSVRGCHQWRLGESSEARHSHLWGASRTFFWGKFERVDSKYWWMVVFVMVNRGWWWWLRMVNDG